MRVIEKKNLKKRKTNKQKNIYVYIKKCKKRNNKCI